MQTFKRLNFKKILPYLAVVIVTATASTFITTSALAAYPEKSVRIVVPFAPGGGTDLVARTLGQVMALELNQPVIIDNKPGGSTIIGTDFVAKSPADGYTMVMATLAHAVNPSMASKLPYVHEKAFAPVMLVGVSPNVLVVKPDSPYKTVADIVADAKSKPGKLSYASQGAGTSAHLAGELFKSITKTYITHIPYRGAGPALTDLMGGQVDFMFATAAAVGSLVESGKLRAIAVTSAARSPTPSLAKLPTIAESGVPKYAAESWYGLFVPAGTPADVIAKINQAAKKAAQSDVFKKRVEKEGLVISAGSPDDFGKYVLAEEVKWKKIIKEANITND